MTAERVTGFKFEMVVGSDRLIQVDGFADAKVGWQATGTLTAPGEASAGVMYARSVGASMWMQMRDWPREAAGCWLPMNDQSPLGIQALTPKEPLYISILGYLHADGFAESSRNTLAGELDLSAALGLLQAQLFEYIEIAKPQIVGAKVPVEIRYEGQRITSVNLDGTAVLTSIEDAGGEVTSMSRTGLENSDYTVTYPAQTSGTDLAAPPAELVVTPPSSGCH